MSVGAGSMVVSKNTKYMSLTFSWNSVEKFESHIAAAFEKISNKLKKNKYNFFMI